MTILKKIGKITLRLSSARKVDLKPNFFISAKVKSTLSASFNRNEIFD